jgi:hypothetical protein
MFWSRVVKKIIKVKLGHKGEAPIQEGKTKFCHVAQASLELMILLSQTPEC